VIQKVLKQGSKWRRAGEARQHHKESESGGGSEPSPSPQMNTTKGEGNAPSSSEGDESRRRDRCAPKPVKSAHMGQGRVEQGSHAFLNIKLKDF